ncbi:MNR2 [Sanghuangporus weigelae]
MPSSSPSRSLRIDLAHPHPHRANAGGPAGDDRDGGSSSSTSHPRRSPTLVRSIDPNDPMAQERQRSLDVDSAMQLSRARSGSVAVGSPLSPAGGVGVSVGGTQPMAIPQPSPKHDGLDTMNVGTLPHFPFLPPGSGDFEVFEGGAHGGLVDVNSEAGISMAHHLSQGHDPTLLVSQGPGAGAGAGAGGVGIGPPVQNESMTGLPLYQPATLQSSQSSFNFGLMDGFVAEERRRLQPPPRPGISSRVTSFAAPIPHPPVGPRAGEQTDQAAGGPGLQGVFVPADTAAAAPAPAPAPDSIAARLRQRKISQSTTPRPRPRRQGGKIAFFEGSSGAPPPSFGIPGMPDPNRYSAVPPYEQTFGADVNGGPSRLPPPLYSQSAHDRPYRFSFYSNKLSATIHARSLSELPAEGQTFADLFTGLTAPRGDKDDPLRGSVQAKPGGENGAKSNLRDSTMRNLGDAEESAWWLDVMSPTDEEMKLLSKVNPVFHIHPLTTEDIQMEETREKIELFRNYYLVCFRSFDQDPYSPTYLEPLNMYIIVFREGTLSFHFRPTPHPQNVRRRIKQLKDYINVTSDWISYALIDDITDAFGPLIQNIEYEVDSIDELVLILKEAEQSDMLRRIGTCRKKVMGLLRLMGNKADVVKGLAKRCNENWSVAPKSDIGLYLSDIQDHLITMTQNLNHYEKILSRSHSNYLAQISIEMTDANNQINDVLSKLTALGTVLIPMNLVTGLWGMNVHVPGEDDKSTYTWFVSIIGGLVGFACLGGFLTYKLMRR